MGKTTRKGAGYLQVEFPGPVGMLSSGITDIKGGTGWARLAYADIGTFRVRQLMVSDQIYTAISEAQDSSDAVVVRIGRYLWWRWGLAVQDGDHVERQGMFTFLLQSFVASVATFLFGAILTAIVGWLIGLSIALLLGLVFIAWWASSIYMNFSAMFGTSSSGEA